MIKYSRLFLVIILFILSVAPVYAHSDTTSNTANSDIKIVYVLDEDSCEDSYEGMARMRGGAGDEDSDDDIYNEYMNRNRGLEESEPQDKFPSKNDQKRNPRDIVLSLIQSPLDPKKFESKKLKSLTHVFKNLKTKIKNVFKISRARNYEFSDQVIN